MNDNVPAQIVPRPPDPAETPEATGRDLREILAVLLDAKWWIISITVGVVLLSTLYVFFATSIYRADALIQIEEQSDNNPLVRMGTALGGLFAITAPAAAEINIMTSRSVLMPVVRKLHLDITAKRKCLPVIGCRFARGDSASVTVTRFQAVDYQRPFILKAGANQSYALYSSQDKRVLTGTVGKPAASANGQTKLYVQALSAPVGTSFALTKIPVQLAAAQLGQRLSVAQLGEKTGVIQLALDGAHPVRIKQILNAIANQYLKQNVAAKSAQARESLAFINKQLPDLKAKLSAAETALSDYRVKRGTVDISQQTASLLTHNVELQGQLSQLKLKEAELAQKFNPKFPTYAALRQQEADVKSQLSSLEDQINHLPKQQQQYVRLKRDVTVYDALYTTLLRKAQDLRVAQAGTVGNVRIVDYAVTPIIPIKPKGKLDIALGLMMGLLLSVLVAFLKRMLSVSIRDPDSLEPTFGAPLYAVIPHSKVQAAIERKTRSSQTAGAAKKMTLLARTQKDYLAVEAMRSLRTSVYFALLGMERPVLTIGSASPGPGKSFVSANLAHLMAQSGQRVLLVDADLRKGHLNNYFGIGRTPGLSEVLSGQMQLDDVVKVDSQPGLNFVSTGSLPQNPSELLLAPIFEKFIIEASDKYDVVLLDVPPYLAVSDGLIVARHAKVNFLLVGDRENTRREIAYVVSRLQHNDIRLTGFIYNDFGRYGSGYIHRSYGARYQYHYR
ncbi:MAG TPA: polysaccharide biosynthesis tyrosine autokinase [Nitrococcus sp.]|nr:polysaccharide biosynthesis tyrosine autokinase [Nitrococcus sp.]